MLRNEVDERSPLRVLDASIDGGVRAGQLGVVLARAGVGKTAFLVQVGLDAVLRDQRVLHVAVDMAVDQVRTWYDELFSDLAQGSSAEERAATLLLLERNRIIQSYTPESFTSDRLGQVVNVLQEHCAFDPDVILVDGLAWEGGKLSTLLALKQIAAAHGARLWMTARTPRDDSDEGGLEMPAGFADVSEAFEVALVLRPSKSYIDLRLVRDHGVVGGPRPVLALHPDTMRLVDQRDTGEFVAPPLERDQYTLFSGAAPGAEAMFGELAERYGLQEVNYTFPTHEPARERGLTELSERKLRQGDVSLTYVARRMNRTYTTSPTFRKVLQSIWHQINNAQQVVVIGIIKEDGTVKGGTGWGAELARVWNKPLWVFDQDKQQWFRWNSLDEKWVPSRTPRLIAPNFAGTGTRFLTDAGREAIAAVFEATFAG